MPFKLINDPVFLNEVEILQIKMRGAVACIKIASRMDNTAAISLCQPNLVRSDLYVVPTTCKPGFYRLYLKLISSNYFIVFRIRNDGRLKRLRRFPISVANETAQTLRQLRDKEYREMEEILEQIYRH